MALIERVKWDGVLSWKHSQSTSRNRDKFASQTRYADDSVWVDPNTEKSDTDVQDILRLADRYTEDEERFWREWTNFYSINFAMSGFEGAGEKNDPPPEQIRMDSTHSTAAHTFDAAGSENTTGFVGSTTAEGTATPVQVGE